MKRRARGLRRFDGVGTLTPRTVGLVATTPQPCSCPMCGNPRRHFGKPTMQERRATLG